MVVFSLFMLLSVAHAMYDQQNMLLKPRFEFPEGPYTSHNSGGEHAQKHQGDIDDINNLRQLHGLEVYSVDDMRAWLDAGGIHVVRQYDGSGAGDAVGYIIVDKTTDLETAEVKDIWVHPEHRRRGIGGWVLAKTMFQPYYPPTGDIVRAIYPRQKNIKCGERVYRTFRIVDDASEILPENLSDYLTLTIPRGMTVVRTTRIKKGKLTEIILDDRTIDYRVDRRSPDFGEVEMWAMKALNPELAEDSSV